MKKHLSLTLCLSLGVALMACEKSKDKVTGQESVGAISESAWSVPTDDGTQIVMRVYKTRVVVTVTCLQSNGENLTATAVSEADVTDKTFRILSPSKDSVTGIDGIECRAGIQTTGVYNYQIAGADLILQDPSAQKTIRYTPAR